MTTIYAGRRTHRAGPRMGGTFCTKTRGRARSSQPCGEPAPRSLPADVPADEVLAALDAIESADVGA